MTSQQAQSPLDALVADFEREAPAMLKSFFVAWTERFSRTSRTVKEIVRASEEDDSALADVLHDIAGEGRGINTKRLGWWLRRNAGRIVDGMRISQTRVSNMASI